MIKFLVVYCLFLCPVGACPGALSRMKRILIIICAAALALFFVYPGPAISAAVDMDAYKARVDRIGHDIAGAAGIEVDIVVTPDTAIDACVYPDGTIVITRGLLDVSRSDDEIAFVIGHEISHVIVRDFAHNTIPAIVDSEELPEHLTREMKADMRGMYFAEKAGYNPYASVKILTRIASEYDYFFEKRIEAISLYLKNSYR